MWLAKAKPTHSLRYASVHHCSLLPQDPLTPLYTAGQAEVLILAESTSSNKLTDAPFFLVAQSSAQDS